MSLHQFRLNVGRLYKRLTEDQSVKDLSILCKIFVGVTFGHIVKSFLLGMCVEFQNLTTSLIPREIAYITTACLHKEKDKEII